ncbi:hypothetical protein [Shewanella xiamenensis]|nr:hypothetical protein [Shewanella xiamenensis]
MAQASTENIVPITVTFLAPPCTVSVPSDVAMGTITYGLKTYRPIDIQVNCSSAFRSSLYAQALGVLESGTINTVLMEGTTAKFWLNAEGSTTKLTLIGSSGVPFCQGNNSRTCVVTPSTLVALGDKHGSTYTIIRFNLRYDA